MKEIESSLHGTLSSSQHKLHTGKCQSCGYTLELYEIDIKRNARVMRCERCGMMHYYKKDIFGKWRLFKATKSELTTR